MLRWISLLMAACFLGACHSPMNIKPPAQWVASSPAPMAMSLAPQQPQDRDATMRVIICYSPLISSHACLLMDGPGSQRLFWDPGGTFGQDKAPYVRQGDVLLDDSALNLQELWQYRRVGCNEPHVLVFEWKITAMQAQHRRAILTRHARDEKGSVLFDADAPGGQCSVYMSAFLRRFCEETSKQVGDCFWPHNLAKQLWQCQPDRVMLIRRPDEVTLYTRE